MAELVDALVLGTSDFCRGGSSPFARTNIYKENMSIKELNNKGLDREWLVTVPGVAVSNKLDEKYLQISKTAKLPGFRPGKVPINMIKERYAKSVLPEVMDDIINTTIKNAVKEKELRPSVQPKVNIEKFEEGNELIFKVFFQIMPEIPDMDLKKISIEKPVLEIKDEDVKRTLEELAEKHERFEPLKKNRSAKKNDLILFDYEGTIGGKKFKGNEGKDETVVIGSNKFIPGYEDQMIGTEIGEKKKINVTFPKDYRVTEIAGKKAQFLISIKDIQSRVSKVKIDDKLATELGEKSLDSLKEKIKEKMNIDYNKFSELKIRREATEKLLKLYKFNLPSKMIDEEINFIKTQSKDKTETEVKDFATRRVKLGLILNNIGGKNNIEVNDQDLTKAVVAETQKHPGQEKKIVDFYKNNPQMMNNLRGVAFEEKVLTFITKACSIKTKNYTFDELFNQDQLKPEKKMVSSQKKGKENE